MKKDRCIVSVRHALMLMVLLLGLPSLSYAYDFVEDGFGYNKIIYPNNAVEVGCYRKLKGEVQIPSSVSYRGKTYKVTQIAYEGFKDCNEITSVTIPNSMRDIYFAAFRRCTNLQSVNISMKLTSLGRAAFRNCSSINQALAIPNTVTSIADETFAGCSNIPSIRLTSMVTSIGNNAFEGCKAIKAFSFPSKISTIGKSAFRYCSNLASVLLPSTVTELGDFAFADCENLESATINSGIEVNYSIFENDNKLKKWDFKGNYTDGVAIYDTKRTKLIKVMNTSIKTYNIGLYSVRYIGPHAFANCKNLIRISALEDFREIGDSAFLNCEKLKMDCSKLWYIRNGSFANCRSLTDVNLSAASSIGSSAFAGCSGLKTVKLSSSSWYIPDALFKDCSELQRVEINNRKLHKIGSEAFMNCKNLTYPWEFLNEDLNIGKDAFTGCTSLKKIRVRRVLRYPGETFAANTIVYVPHGCKKQYQTILPKCTIYEDYDKESSEYKKLLSLYNSYNELDYQPLVRNDLSTGDNVLTEASQLSANFIDDYEGSLDALVDNSDDTYFLSPWDKDNPTKAYHYIQADLKKAYKSLNISFKRRNTSDPSAPTKVRVFVTNTPNDENSWIDCGIASLNYNGLEATINSHYYDKMRYVRLQVEATTDNAKDNGNLFFALNKLVIKPSSFNVPIEKWDDGLYYAIRDESTRKTFNKGTLMGTSPLEPDYSNRLLSLSFSSPIKYGIIKYLKSSNSPTSRMWFSNNAESNNAKDYFDADYRYFDESTGIYCKQSENPFGSSLLGAYSGKLQSAHIYTRPPKADLMPKERRTTIQSMLSQYDNENFVRKEDGEILQNYCNEITRCAQTGRYVDFLDYDYWTFYADYPAVVPMLVKAGIVKEENGELVVDYIYNEGDVIPANTGVILKGNCRGNAYVMEEGTTDATSPEGNLLHGTIKEEETYVEGCNRYYMLSYDKATDARLGFYWNGEDGPRPFTNKAYRAFLALPNNLNSIAAECFSMKQLEDGCSTITNINNATADKGNHAKVGIYSIDGRKIDATNIKQLPAGVYIVNGRKVIVK